MRALTDFGKCLLGTWLVIALVVWMVCAMSCALLGEVIETTVRRFDSLASLDRGCDELGGEGWRVVAVTPLDGGAAYVVVLQRRAAR